MFLEPGYQKRESGLWVPDQAGFVPIPGIGPALPFIRAPAKATKTDQFSSAASGPYTATSAAFGTAFPGRIICVAVVGIGPSLAVRTLSSVTIAGNAATLVAPGAAQGVVTAWAYIVDTVNTTGNIVATFNSTTASAAMVVYSLAGATALIDTDNPYVTASATTLVMSLDEQSGGVSLYHAVGIDATGAVVGFSSATLDQNYNPNTNSRGASGSYSAIAGASNRAETITWNAGMTNRSGAAMHWR